MSQNSSAMHDIMTMPMQDKENLVDKMPKLFGSAAKDRVEFSRPASATTNQRFSRPSSSMNETRANKGRGLASRPTTANVTSKTRATNFTGGKMMERNGEKFVLTEKIKQTGYKKNPHQSTTNYLTTTTSSYIDPTTSLRGKKKLEPYRPDSARSRLPVRFKSEPKPFTRHCKPTNTSQFTIGVPDADWEAWKKKVVTRKRPVSAMA